MNSTTKHLLHCTLLITVIVTFEVFSGGIKIDENSFTLVDPWTEYGQLATVLLYLLRFLTLLTLPQVLFNFCGLVFYNAFPEKVVLKGSPCWRPSSASVWSRAATSRIWLRRMCCAT